MAAVEEEVDSSLVSKCMAFCNALASQGQVFNFSISVGRNFSFSLDTRSKAIKDPTVTKKKASPSTLRRNAKRREEFYKKQPTSSASNAGDGAASGASVMLKCDQCVFEAVSEKRLSEHIKMIHKAPVLPVTPKSGPEKLRSQGWSSTGSLNCSPILPNTRLETCRNCEAIFSPGHQCNESGKLDKTEPEPISKPPYPNERIYYQPCRNYGKSCFEKNSGCTKIPGGTDIYCGPCFQLL